ncbi:MAG: ribosome maturation factor RimM [Alphaproteobacteria bacterium]
MSAGGDVSAGWICVGVIGRPKGVRGLMHVTSYTERPADIAAYGPVYDAPDGRAVDLALRETAGGAVVASIAGVEDRESAAALTGTRLWLPRAALPEPETDEYYHADLVGLSAERTDGSVFGAVTAVHDFGAGAVLELTPEAGGSTVMLPFTREVVPEIDIAGGRLVVVPPDETAAEDTGAET